MKACIIIDDPFLRDKYGFLDFYKLLDLMDRHNFHTTIAFIPWNYNRTISSVARLFRERSDRFSLCVHGCDHTRAEYGIADEIRLDKITKLALSRMDAHERMTGITYARVMVFPQGYFSNAALRVLQKNNFSAAINTETVPCEGGAIEAAIPFYRRFRPEDAVGQVTDPLFIALHHDYFMNEGYKRLGNFVDKMSTSSAADIEWCGVGDIIKPKKAKTKEIISSRLNGIQTHGLAQNAKIMLRRYLCDVRDNILMPLAARR